jgi:membrane associated rhomboid family serine protease
MFMHGGWGHILGNMWFLWIFGDNIENDLGKLWYIVFYLACGILAGFAHIFGTLATSGMGGEGMFVPCLGASGAISGVMGAYLLLHPMRRVTVIIFRFLTDVPGYVAVGLWFAMQVGLSLMGAGGGVAYGAHIGGFIAGALLVLPLRFFRRPTAADLGQSMREQSGLDDDWRYR